MIILQAPSPNFEVVTFLPNPQNSDTEFPLHGLSIRRAMDGTRSTYVSGDGSRRLTYEFRLSRQKSLELEAFVNAYYSSKIRLINHKDEIWLVNFTSNPFQFSRLYDSIVSIQLQLEGQKL